MVYSLALCHIVPRDLFLRLSVVFLLVACGLLAAVVATYEEDSSLATVETNNVKMLLKGELKSSDGTLFCSGNKKPTDACKDFVYYIRVGGLLCVLSLAFTILVIVSMCFFITPCSRTSTQMFTFVWVVLFLPLGFVLASGGIIAGRGLKRGLDAASVPSDSSVKYGTSFKCLIAAMAFMIAAFILATVRFIFACYRRGSVKRKFVESRDITGIMNLRVVNDDWTRQKRMWELHAQAVHVEIQAALEEEAVEESNATGEGAENSDSAGKTGTPTLQPVNASMAKSVKNASMFKNSMTSTSLAKNSSISGHGRTHSKLGAADDSASDGENPVFVHTRRVQE